MQILNRRKAIRIAIPLLLLYACHSTDADMLRYEDPSLPVYGPYRVFRLPVEKGVNILNPLLIASDPDGRLWASNETGEIYHLVDTDGDSFQDSAALFCHVGDAGLHAPASIAFRADTVYVGTREEIRIYLDRNRNGQADTSWTFFNSIPESQHPYEWTSGICFGPDGWLYAALTTDSWNAGASPDPEGYRGAIIRISPEGKAERVATGLRSAYGMTFDSEGHLFFADNGGGGNPQEELNLLVPGDFYGHNGKKYGVQEGGRGPVHALQSELAPGGIEFNSMANDFGGTGGHLFVALYGPAERWNRGAVAHLALEHRGGTEFACTEHVLADIPKLSDLCFGADGALYVAHHGKSDYWYKPVESRSGGFYRIVHDAGVRGKDSASRGGQSEQVSASALESGEFLFAERACLSCHAIDGDTELLGPGLQNIRAKLSREQILEEIKDPSKIITPSMTALRVTKTDGQIFLGRPVNIGPDTISLMLIGNTIVRIPRTEIDTTEHDMKSLMYEGLLYDLSDEEIDNLLDYIMSL